MSALLTSRRRLCREEVILIEPWIARADRRRDVVLVRHAVMVLARDESPSSHTPRLGSRMAALFADVGLEEPISEWRGVEPVPEPFEP
jgi:hypothetical protein